MADAKIEFQLGSISFLGEGDKDWVSEQLDKILEKAPDLLRIEPKHTSSLSSFPIDRESEDFSETLAIYLKSKNVTVNQNKRFLATAAWLRLRGQNRITTSDVSKALKNNNQIKLTNPSECLNQNVRKGYCEKDGKRFFVTDEGLVSL